MFRKLLFNFCSRGRIRTDDLMVMSHERIITDGERFSIPKVKSATNRNLVKKFTIELGDIENRINNIGEDIKTSIDTLYNEISIFQYNIETLITGKTDTGKIIKEQEDFNKCYDDSNDNLKKIKDILENL